MASISQVTLSDLPLSLQQKIPFSIRTYKDNYTLQELPVEIQYLIEKYYEQMVPEIDYPDMLDAKFEISAYSDLGIYSSTKELVLDYLKRYLIIKLGSYPYDVLFGCYLKEQIHTKDTSLRQTLIANEISQIANVLGNDYDLSIRVKSYDIYPVKEHDHTAYHIKLSLEIDGEDFSIATSE